MPMVIYAQVKRTPGRAPEINVQQTPPEGWDDSEEKELEWLARGAGALAHESLRELDAQKAAECRKKMLNEVRTAN